MATENECVICFENIGEKNNCVTECGHKFCLKCLVTSIAHKNACPCCRAQLIDEIEGDDEEEDEDFVPMENDDESDNDADHEKAAELFCDAGHQSSSKDFRAGCAPKLRRDET